MGVIYEKALQFKQKYPFTIAWRLHAHAKVIEKHLNSGEEVLYVFPAQKSDETFEMFHTYLLVLTNKRILLGSKRVIFGYFFTAITPDMFNDIAIRIGIFWGKVHIDSIKEIIELSNIQKDALPEIESEISQYMMREKRKVTIHSDEKIDAEEDNDASI